MCELVKDYLSSLEKVESRRRKLKQSLERLQNKLNTGYHILETNKLPADKLVKLASSMSKVAKERREVKNEYNMLLSLNSKFNIQDMINKTEESIKKVETSVERVKQECIDSAIKFMTDGEL